jgi:uncharacterized protein YlxP (DUF503 family)
MFVGVARLVFQIPNSRSLKDRRQVVKSFKERARARFPVSVSEVGDVERHQVATIGVATVARDSGYVQTVLSQLRELAQTSGDAVLSDVKTEIFAFGSGGESIRGGIEDLARQDPDEFADLAERWGKP